MWLGEQVDEYGYCGNGISPADLGRHIVAARMPNAIVLLISMVGLRRCK